MTRKRHVLLMIDEALFLKELAPVLYVRSARKHLNCLEFARDYDWYNAGLPGPAIVQLDDPALRRRAQRRRAKNSVARESRKRNRAAA